MNELESLALQIGGALFKELIHAAETKSLTHADIERARRLTEDLAAARAEKAAADAIMRKHP